MNAVRFAQLRDIRASRSRTGGIYEISLLPLLIASRAVMRCPTLSCLVVAAFLTTGCVANHEVEASKAEALQAIDQLHERYVQAMRKPDVGAFLETISDNFRLLPPNEPGVQGKEGMKDWFNTTFGAFKIVSLEFPETEVHLDHDWAIQRYTYEWTLEPIEGGESVTDRGNGLYVYQRESDGSWKVVYDIWTTDKPLPEN